MLNTRLIDIIGKTSRVTAKKNVGKRMKGGSDKLDEFFMGDMNSTSDPNDTDTVKRAISNGIIADQ